MLKLDQVSKRYKKQIVFQDLSAAFPIGVTILTGPSGVGKSTLLRLCASVEKPNSGAILWNDQSLAKVKRSFRSVLGYAPQIVDFPEDLTALEFMTHIGALKGLRYKEAKLQTETLLARLNLLPDIDKQIRGFSGGMRRRLGLAQAFLGRPECLIIDEPTAELDSETAGLVHDLIFEAGQSAVIIMTTHLQSSLTDYSYQSLHLDGSHSG